MTTRPDNAGAGSDAGAGADGLGWDGAAQGWDRHTPMLRAWLQAPTAALLDAVGLAPGKRVLDIAAGAGDQTLDIARRAGPDGYVLATDISAHMLDLARGHLERAGFNAVQTRVADAQDPADDATRGTFDAVVCRLGLMFCQQPLSALASALSALKPGGHFGALVFSEPKANPCIAIMASTAHRHTGQVPASPFLPGTLLSLGQPGLMQELLTAAGFSQIRVRAISAPMQLPDAQTYLAFVQSAGLPITAMLAPLPAHARRAAWQDIEDQLAAFNTADGWVGPNELLLCTATRPLQ